MKHLHRRAPHPKVWVGLRPLWDLEEGFPSDGLVSRTRHLLHKIASIDSAWEPQLYYLYVRPHRMAGFLNDWRESSIFPHFHGHLLASCAGHEPTPEVKQMLMER